MFFWLLSGIAVLKAKLAHHAHINVSLLPLNQEFSNYLLEEKSKGRKIFLATASNEAYAKEIVKHSNVFDGYIASTDTLNLKGKEKLKKISEISENFAYAGNDEIDFNLFEKAQESLLVNPSYGARKKAHRYKIHRCFDSVPSDIKVWVKLLRIYQWVKNFLIFVPLIVSGNFMNYLDVFATFAAFFAFSLLASSTYLLNDLLDLESDRAHARKKYRPLAAGTISIKNALVVGCLLFFSSLTIAFYFNLAFVIVMLSYLLLTLFYSFKLKQYVGMDVVCLALLYTIRIVAGAAVIGVLVSFWLFAFSVFVFLSLALIKRCAELKAMLKSGKERVKGRDYTVDDFVVLESFGTSSAMLAVLKYCFYINNNVLTNQYQQPNILWLIVPGLCYWLMRMWIKTHRGEMHDDPIVFSMKDKGSLITISFWGFVTLAAQLL